MVVLMITMTTMLSFYKNVTDRVNYGTVAYDAYLSHRHMRRAARKIQLQLCLT